jgi:hypothetical protein
MIREALYSLLLQDLEPFLRDGFRFSSSQGCLVRGTPNRSERVWLRLTYSHDRHVFSPEVSIRFKAIEDLFHRSSGFEPKYHRGTQSLGACLSDLDSSLQPFLSIASSDGTKEAASLLLGAYPSVITPFFKRFPDIAAIDAYLNDDPVAPRVARSMLWLRASTAVIAAYLNQNSALPTLASTYRVLVARDAYGFYLPAFDRLLADLALAPAGA